MKKNLCLVKPKKTKTKQNNYHTHDPGIYIYIYIYKMDMGIFVPYATIFSPFSFFSILTRELFSELGENIRTSLFIFLPLHPTTKYQKFSIPEGKIQELEPGTFGGALDGRSTKVKRAFIFLF